MAPNIPGSQRPTQLPLQLEPSSSHKPQITFEGVALSFWWTLQQYFPLCSYNAHSDAVQNY